MPEYGQYRSAEVLHGTIYRGLLRHALFRLTLLYFVPLLLLTLFFHLQYRGVVRDAEHRHRQSLATHRAAMLEFLLGDRLLKLTDLTDHPEELIQPDPDLLATRLAELQRDSAAFIDLSVLDETGGVLGYAGPLPHLREMDYGQESWFTRLQEDGSAHVITGIYPGFRNEPHFTMALRLMPRGQVRVIRAALAPGILQVELAEVDPGFEEPGGYLGRSLATNIWWVSLVFCLLGGLVIWLQARWVARQQFAARMKERELSRQLDHAARLALVGEMAAGIAHEINNPLAVVAEKAGLMKDLLDSRFGQRPAPERLTEQLDSIEEAVFRCTGITRQLLGFVRPGDLTLTACDVHDLIDGLARDLLGTELEVSDIELIRRYDPALESVLTDPNQLQQVVLNLLKNAADSIDGPGTITVTTRRMNGRFILRVSDTGHGMTAQEKEKVFMPFFTTKAPGKGTGLGLSVSYGIVKGLGGSLTVSSAPEAGSTFTIELPLRR